MNPTARRPRPVLSITLLCGGPRPRREFAVSAEGSWRSCPVSSDRVTPFARSPRHFGASGAFPTPSGLGAFLPPTTIEWKVPPSPAPSPKSTIDRPSVMCTRAATPIGPFRLTPAGDLAALIERFFLSNKRLVNRDYSPVAAGFHYFLRNSDPDRPALFSGIHSPFGESSGDGPLQVLRAPSHFLLVHIWVSYA